jgi:hypothetical protein
VSVSLQYPVWRSFLVSLSCLSAGPSKWFLMTEVFAFSQVQTTQIRNKEGIVSVLCAEHYSKTEGGVSLFVPSITVIQKALCWCFVLSITVRHKAVCWCFVLSITVRQKALCWCFLIKTRTVLQYSVSPFLPALEYHKTQRDCVFLPTIKTWHLSSLLLLRPERLYIVRAITISFTDMLTISETALGTAFVINWNW